MFVAQQLTGNDVQRLGDVFAHLHDAVGPAAGAGGRSFEHDPLVGQVAREWPAGRTAVFVARDCRGLCRLLGGDLVLGGCGFELFEQQFYLGDQRARRSKLWL